MPRVHVRGWLGLGLVIIAALVLCLSALAQAREHARVPGGSAVGVLLLRGRHPFLDGQHRGQPARDRGSER